MSVQYSPSVLSIVEQTPSFYTSRWNSAKMNIGKNVQSDQFEPSHLELCLNLNKPDHQVILLFSFLSLEQQDDVVVASRGSAIDMKVDVDAHSNHCNEPQPFVHAQSSTAAGEKIGLVCFLDVGKTCQGWKMKKGREEGIYIAVGAMLVNDVRNNHVGLRDCFRC